MGVVNVTDDSFSDGGRYLDADCAVKQGLALAADGASIVDVGGESTRPGAVRIDPQVETARVVPVVKELASQGITVSIDTMHAGVARAALESGAQMVNDVSGGRADEAMADLLGEADVPWVLMHWRSVSSDHPHQVPTYRDVVAEVRADLLACVDDAVAALRSVLTQCTLAWRGRHWKVALRWSTTCPADAPMRPWPICSSRPMCRGC